MNESVVAEKVRVNMNNRKYEWNQWKLCVLNGTLATIMITEMCLQCGPVLHPVDLILHQPSFWRCI